MNASGISLAKAADLPGILALIKQQDMSPENAFSQEEGVALFARMKSNPWHEIYVARTDGDIVGTFSLLVNQLFSHNGGRALIVEDVAVKKSCQGKGIGRAMMEFAVARAKELGCYKIMLSSGVQRTEAHAFYENMGFKRHGFSFLLDVEKN